MTAPPRHQVKLRLRPKDRERVQLIAAAYGVSFSAAITMAIRAAAHKLGLGEKANDLM